MPSQEPGPRPSPDPLRDLLDGKSLADEITKAIEGNDCPGDRELLAYARKELSEGERIEIKSHLLFCGRCRDRATEIERNAPRESAAGTPLGAEGKSFGGFRISPASTRGLHPGWLKVAGATAGVLALGLASAFFLTPGSDLPYRARVVYAEGASTLRRGEKAAIEIRTPRPVYLIEITIDAPGHIGARILPGERDGIFADGERFPFTPAAAGFFDLYIVPCPAGEGFPQAILDGILKFVRTESSINRENQRRGIEMALGFHRLKWVHEIYRIEP